MRLFLGIILLIICTYIGYLKANKYYLRSLFYNDFQRFNDKLKQEVSFKQSTIKDLLVSETSETDFFKGIKAKFLQNEKVSLNINYLNNNELNQYQNYIHTIGSGDILLQTEFLQNLEEDVVKTHKQCVMEEEKYKKLYVKLGFFVGLIMLILVL